MPEILCTTVYQFPELSDAAKEKARGWYREAAFTDVVRTENGALFD